MRQKWGATSYSALVLQHLCCPAGGATTPQKHQPHLLLLFVESDLCSLPHLLSFVCFLTSSLLFVSFSSPVNVFIHWFRCSFFLSSCLFCPFSFGLLSCGEKSGRLSVLGLQTDVNLMIKNDLWNVKRARINLQKLSTTRSKGVLSLCDVELHSLVFEMVKLAEHQTNDSNNHLGWTGTEPELTALQSTWGFITISLKKPKRKETNPILFKEYLD